jgi:hypothetical protein
MCPPQHALLGTAPRSGSDSPPRAVGLVGVCCQLPSSDILTEEHLFTWDQCPSGYISTGVRLGKDGTCNRHRFFRLFKFTSCEAEQGYQLRCSKVNTRRYQLGSANNGQAWGNGTTRRFGVSVLRRSELPPAVRYGLMRREQSVLFSAGCVGTPIGSVLTGKSTKECSGLTFKQIEYRGIDSDPPRGTAVQMYPNCDSVINPFASEPECQFRQ